MAPLGFTYAKSRQELRRRRENSDELINFQSSHSNTAGAYVAMWPHANVRSAALGKWRAVHSPRQGDYFAGGQLGNLAGLGWATWDLADVQTRSAVIDDVVRVLHSVALPFFDLVQNTDALIARALNSDISGFEIEGLADYLVFLERQTAASNVVRAWLERRRGANSSGDLAQLRRVVEQHGLAVQLPSVPSPGEDDGGEPWHQRVQPSKIDYVD